MFSPQQDLKSYWEMRGDDSLMLVTIRDDTRYVLNMHITPYSKRWDYSDSSAGGHKKIKGPAHMVEGGYHLRKAPNPNSQQTEGK